MEPNPEKGKVDISSSSSSGACTVFCILYSSGSEDWSVCVEVVIITTTISMRGMG